MTRSVVYANYQCFLFSTESIPTRRITKEMYWASPFSFQYTTFILLNYIVPKYRKPTIVTYRKKCCVLLSSFISEFRFLQHKRERESKIQNLHQKNILQYFKYRHKIFMTNRRHGPSSTRDLKARAWLGHELGSPLKIRMAINY